MLDSNWPIYIDSWS